MKVKLLHCRPIRTQQTPQWSQNTIETGHNQDPNNDIVIDKNKERQRRYRERNREKLRQRELERKRRMKLIAELTKDANSQSLSGFEGTQTSVQENVRTQQTSQQSLNTLETGHNKDLNNDIVIDKKKERQRRYREKNREILRQRELERQKRKRLIAKLREDANSLSLSGLEGMQTPSVQENAQVQTKNAIEKRRERQKRYKEKLKQHRAEHRKCKRNSVIIPESSISTIGLEESHEVNANQYSLTQSLSQDASELKICPITILGYVTDAHEGNNIDNVVIKVEPLDDTNHYVDIEVAPMEVTDVHVKDEFVEDVKDYFVEETVNFQSKVETTNKIGERRIENRYSSNDTQTDAADGCLVLDFKVEDDTEHKYRPDVESNDERSPRTVNVKDNDLSPHYDISCTESTDNIYPKTETELIVPDRIQLDAINSNAPESKEPKEPILTKASRSSEKLEEKQLRKEKVRIRQITKPVQKTQITEESRGKRIGNNGLHTNEKPYKCDVCNKRFKQKINLNSHNRIHSGEKPYKCDICEKSFNHKVNLKSHKRIHTGEKPYKCEICEKYFNQRSNLKTHMNVHTGEKQYICNICGRCFSRKSCLNIHIHVHAEEKPYKCDVCQKGFTCKVSLNTHSYTHSDEKLYKCSICDKGFNRKSHLHEHHRVHTDEKPFKCDICEACFKSKGYLKAHILAHNSEKLHRCITCGMCFSRQEYLKKHMNVHTDIKPYKCDLCTQYFRYKYNLTRHVRNYHTDKNILM